jgi:hypothetical protein
MTYDDWKLETPEDEYWRKHRRAPKNDGVCDRCYADGFNWDAPTDAGCCYECGADLPRNCEDCDDAIGTVFAEDLTGYSGKPGEWLCARCYDRRCDYPEPDREWPQARNE